MARKMKDTDTKEELVETFKVQIYTNTDADKNPETLKRHDMSGTGRLLFSAVIVQTDIVWMATSLSRKGTKITRHAPTGSRFQECDNTCGPESERSSRRRERETTKNPRARKHRTPSWEPRRVAQIQELGPMSRLMLSLGRRATTTR